LFDITGRQNGFHSSLSNYEDGSAALQREQRRNGEALLDGFCFKERSSPERPWKASLVLQKYAERRIASAYQKGDNPGNTEENMETTKTPMTIKVIVFAIVIAFPLLAEAQSRFVPGHTFAPANVHAGADLKACVNNLFEDNPVHLLWLIFRATDSSKPIATKELILNPKQGNCSFLRRDILHQLQADRFRLKTRLSPC